MSLVCTGEAKWDWIECATTFTITSLKYNTENELIPGDNSIIIKKYYNDEANAKNDITESDVLVELLKNNKLFYENDGKKYVFNKVDFNKSKIVYYYFLSKYVNRLDYNMIYCLNCALHHKLTYRDEKTGYYKYSSTYGIPAVDINNCRCYLVSTASKQSLNAYGNTETYYDVQRGFLDSKAGGDYHNRMLDNYDPEQYGQKLCTLEHLKNGWKNQSA